MDDSPTPSPSLQGLAADLRILLGALSRRLREQAHVGDFTSSQKSVLLRLERDGPATVSTLARADGVRPQSMGATVSSLQVAGLISGDPDPTDGRQIILSLTPTCRDRIQAGRAAREDWLLRAIQANLNAHEQHDLAQAVDLLKRLLAPTPPRPAQETSMALTTLDPISALILIDLQQGIAAIPTAHPIRDVVTQATALAEAFRRHGLPVVLVNVAAAGALGRTERPTFLPAELPPGWSDLLPELQPQPGDHIVTKHSRGAFTNTGLAATLKARGVTQIVLAGVATSSGVETTAMQAYELGLNVTLATDAMTDRSLDAHTYTLTQVFPRLGESGTTRQVLTLLESTRP